MQNRTILHLDMNAFFAAVEQRTNPHLKGKPVLVCGNPKGRTVIISPSYEARAFGVKTGMNLWEAKKLCKNSILVECNPANYVEVANHLQKLFIQFTPLVEIFSIDECFLDVSGCQRLFGSGRDIALKIKKRVREELDITCSVGIGPNKLLAKLGSHLKKPDGLVIIEPEKIQQVLENLPIQELCGIGPRITEKLNKLGVYTCGQLARYPVEILQRMYGIVGLHLHDIAWGVDDSPVMPYDYVEPAKSVGHSFTLPKDTFDREVAKKYLLQLSEQVARRLRKGNYKGKTVHLIIRIPDFTTLGQQVTIRKFLDEGVEIYHTAVKILDKFNVEAIGVRLLGVSVSNLICGSSQLSLMPEENRRQCLIYAMDKINDKYGEFSVTWGRLVSGFKQNNIISPAWRPHKNIRFGYN
ncbi:MAG: DNA polymerase IV [candidate division Zixibacteria bacterium RBG-1]|nr:MAG: DNA polymerase IV [candidate division Zixibacteria bacterium RBG-1]OGC84610.1 MAG: hypothetical protein A2V73_07550 [candidate division Zixibacteria bacterium RBG_19FT_COMBO_42_43]